MTTKLPFGLSQACEIMLGEHAVLAPSMNAHPAVEDPVAALRAALAKPLEFPPLAAATAPGDRVTVALGDGIPQVRSVARGIVAALADGGVEASQVTMLCAMPAEEVAQLAGALEAELAQGLKLERHVPDDEHSIAMLGLTASGRALRFNRALTEADFVLPVSATSRRAADGAPESRFDSVYPKFSNRETIDRLRPTSAGGAKQRAARTAEIDEAGWLLGVIMSVSVVPGPGGAVAGIVAGDPQAVSVEAARRAQAIWERPVAEQGDLVIAAVPGDSHEQTWDNLARAIVASERVLRPDGAIAICCELAEPPPKAFKPLVEAIDFAAARQQLRRDAGHNARSARILAQALERGPVYLRSRLPAEVVESLGMTPIENDAELCRLASGRAYCVVIEEAQRVRPRYLGDRNGVD